MQLVAPVRDGVDLREALGKMEGTTDDGSTRDVFLGAHPCLDASGMKMVYYTNWKLAIEDGPEAANGEYRLYDLSTGRDEALSVASVRCLGWTRSGLLCFVDFQHKLVVLNPETKDMRVIATLKDVPLCLVGDEVLAGDAEGVTAIDVETGESRMVLYGLQATSIVVDDGTRDRAVVVVRADAMSTERILCLYRSGEDSMLLYSLTPGLRITGISWLDAGTVLIATTDKATKIQKTYAIGLDEFQKEGVR
jgi:hypothetical protein